MLSVRILVVEDERKLAQALQTALKAEHYEVVVATTGEDGFMQHIALAGAVDYRRHTEDRLRPAVVQSVSPCPAAEEEVAVPRRTGVTSGV